MSLKFIDILIEMEKENRKYFKDYLKYVREIKMQANKDLKKPKVFVFGSILRKKEIPRDIDILVVSPSFAKIKAREEFLLKIKEKIASFPFEFHLITPKEYKSWYKNFIKEKKLIK